MATLTVKNVPDRLYRRIKQRAASNHRSISQEVVHLLDAATQQKATASILELKGLSETLWRRELDQEDASDYVEHERESWR